MKAPLLSLEITRFEKTGGPLTKRVYLKPDGAIANDSSDCRMSRGVMHRQHLLDWRALACLIEETPRNTAYALGVMRPDLPDSVPLVTRRDPRSAQPGFATRTAETILYREGRPGPVLLDYDTKGMPPDIRARMQECGGFRGALETVCAGFADAKRFLYTLHDRCWLAGLAWYIVGKCGSLLERTIIDRTVCAAERLVFEASPDLDPPLAQEKREATIHDGAPLDTKAACADLNGVEQVELRQRKAAAARALGNEVDAAKKTFVKAQVEAAVARGMDRSKAQRVAEQWGKGVLRPGVILEFDDPDLGAVSVADILADPERFDGETLSDPVEGVSYGRNCAIIQVRDGMPSIFRFRTAGPGTCCAMILSPSRRRFWRPGKTRQRESTAALSSQPIWTRLKGSGSLSWPASGPAPACAMSKTWSRPHGTRSGKKNPQPALVKNPLFSLWPAKYRASSTK
jgi:hypothetical protein